jgi:hypothetical protein
MLLLLYILAGNTNKQGLNIMLYAHYFKAGKTHHITLSDSPRPVGKSFAFSSKTLAKQFAKDNKATPYNY